MKSLVFVICAFLVVATFATTPLFATNDSWGPSSFGGKSEITYDDGEVPRRQRFTHTIIASNQSFLGSRLTVDFRDGNEAMSSGDKKVVRKMIFIFPDGSREFVKRMAIPEGVIDFEIMPIGTKIKVVLAPRKVFRRSRGGPYTLETELIWAIVRIVRLEDGSLDTSPACGGSVLLVPYDPFAPHNTTVRIHVYVDSRGQGPGGVNPVGKGVRSDGSKHSIGGSGYYLDEGYYTADLNLRPREEGTITHVGECFRPDDVAREPFCEMIPCTVEVLPSEP